MKNHKGIITYSTLTCIAVLMTNMGVSLAYENFSAHPEINGAIADEFDLRFTKSQGMPAKFANYLVVMSGYSSFPGPSVTESGNWEIVEEEQSMTPKDWIKHGGLSADEPEVFAALRHFYDPKGINNGQYHLTNRGTYWEGLAANPGIDAKSWALTNADNQWGWKKGLQYVKQALEATDQGTRDQHMAKAYRCLGETMHLLADMGCPVHVRNDSHAPSMALGLLGDPDPYESSVTDELVVKKKDGKPEPELVTQFGEADTADALFETLAQFTNTNFFTNQTIVGNGVEEIEPINDDQPAYPSPRLEDFTYEPDEFTFYRTFTSGVTVKMCKDHSYFSYRGYPYIDSDCAESQAAVLIPNIIEGGVNLVRLFIPTLTVVIDDINGSGEVQGHVTHTPDTEYTSQITYNGPVRIYTPEGDLAIVNAVDGAFTGQVIIPEYIKEVSAEIAFGGIYIHSEPYVDFERSSGLVIIEDNTRVDEYGTPGETGFHACFMNTRGKVKNMGPDPSMSYPRPSVRINYYVGGEFRDWSADSISTLEVGEVYDFYLGGACFTSNSPLTWELLIVEEEE